MHVDHGAGAVGPPRRRRCTQPADDIGVHLTLNAEHAAYRWGPITHAPSLLSGEGGFPRDPIDDLWEHADPDEVLPRVPGPDRAGARVGHRRRPTSPRTSRRSRCGPSSSTSTSSWPSSSACRSGCRRRSPPSRPGSRSASWPPTRASCSPTTSTTTGAPAAATGCYAAIRDLQPGVTEIHVQPAIDTPEVRALSDGGRRLDRRPRAGRPTTRRCRRCSPSAARRADRLPRAQGRDASRLSTARRVARLQQLEQRAGRPGRLQPPCMNATVASKPSALHRRRAAR